MLLLVAKHGVTKQSVERVSHLFAADVPVYDVSTRYTDNPVVATEEIKLTGNITTAPKRFTPGSREIHRRCWGPAGLLGRRPHACR